jgi:hypothetical protein
MSGNIFDAVLGRFYNSGVEVELGAGVDCLRGVQSSKNASNQRVDLSADCPYVYRKGYAYRGDSTTVATGAGTVALALNLAATTIAIGSVVTDGSSVECTARVWVSKSDGTVLFRDEISFAVYRETATSELHLLDLSQSGADDIGTGTRTLTLTGANSGLDYTVTASHGGTLGVAIEQDAAIARYARLALWIGESEEIPTS